LLVALLGVSFFFVSYATRSFLDYKFRKAAAKVEEVGGSAYTGPRYFYHEFWHAVWCGLGDFDTKKGYVWKDIETFKFVQPKLQAMHPEEKIPAYYHLDRTYDKAGKYPVFIGEISGYHDIVREKILSDIKSDPLWYLDILKKRVNRILSEATPVGIAFKEDAWRVGGRAVGWMWIPLFAFVLAARRWWYAKLMLFSWPLSISAIVVFSDRGVAWYSTYHIFGVFVLVALVAEGARSWWRRRRSVVVA
jgi:hypothetical protein